MTVFHPRYLLIPKISMPLHGLLMFCGSYGLVRKLQRKNQFAAIDAHYVYPDGFAAILLGRRLRLPVVISARGTDMNLFPRFKLIRPMIRWTLRRVAGGIGVCTPLREAMVEMGLPLKHSTVIGNGIDLERFQPIERGEARRLLGLPAAATVLLAVGALIPRKGFHLLIPTFARIVKEKPNSYLYIIGEGNQRAELETLSKKLGVSDRVCLVGVQPNEELNKWYSSADVSCLVSSREGWPNVLLESLACGTPVVATTVWGVPEVITSPKLGVLVEQNLESITQGLNSALGQQWDRRALIEHARSRTWDVVAKELEHYFFSRLGPAGTGASPE
jgi:teichuronic acid biosynthesis glycosyltransferase TuaC